MTNSLAAAQNTNVIVNVASLPLIATLRKGGPKGDKRPGRDLDHFRVVFRPGYERLLPTFQRLYGNEPRELDGVRFLDGQPFTFCYEAWRRTNQTIRARHDGKVYTKRWTDENGYSFTPDPVTAADLEDCKPVGRLTFMLEDFFRVSGVVGVFIALTGSTGDRDTVQAYLAVMEHMNIPLTAVPFTLRRVPRQFTVNIEGKPSSVTKHMWELSAEPDTVLAAMSQVALPQHVNPVTGEIADGVPALSAGHPPDVIEAEFTDTPFDSATSDRQAWHKDAVLITGLRELSGWNAKGVLNKLALLTERGLITLATPSADVVAVFEDHVNGDD